MMLTEEELAEKKYSLDGYLCRHTFTAEPISLADLESHYRAIEE
jgi:hypothetical protein